MSDFSRDSDDGDSEITQEEIAAMMRAVMKLFRKWKVTDDQAVVIFGAVDRNVFDLWKKDAVGSVPMETVGRLHDLIGIHNRLREIFGDSDHAYVWISRPNTVFDGDSAFTRLLRGTADDVSAVCRYLDAEVDGA